MKMYVGVTDYDWFTILKESKCDEVNFWRPGSSTFKVLEPNDMFLFKLHSPNNYIVGGGFFVRFSILPTHLAWNAFGIKNGTHSLKDLNESIFKYRERNNMALENPQIGCIILTEPFFFDKEDWILIPANWSNSIVQGKTYDTSDSIGMQLYQDVMSRIGNYQINEQRRLNRYAEYLTKHRLGQGAFRIVVTDAYQRRCSISGEKTLPVLEAAHIKPYAEQGPHEVSNGILLRSDLHTLYDDGYITIDKDYRVDVSKRLHEDFGNGKDYYKYHGSKLFILPESVNEMPSKEYLEWHNENVFLG